MPWILGMVVLLSSQTTSLCQEEQTPGDRESADPQQWTGTLDVGPVQLRMYFEWSDGAASNGFKGFVISLDQGNAKIALESAAFEGGSLTIDVPKVRGKFVGDVTEDGQAAKGTWTQFGQSHPLTIRRVKAQPKDEWKEAWNGVLKSGAQDLKLQLRILDTEQGLIARFDSLSQNATGLSAVLIPTDAKLVFEVPSVQGRFEGDLSDDGSKAIGTWKQHTTELPLELTRSDTVAEKSPKPARPQTPQEPFPYDATAVVIENSQAGVQLAGTLTTPHGTGPFPAVVLVSGSGPQDRDEALLGHQPFWILADHFSRKGIAVLRYDDRGFGDSTGEFASATTVDFAADAAEAIRFLQRQDLVDPKRLGIVGHSEGGIVAAMLSASDLPLAHIVMLAGPGVPGDEIIRSQTKAILAKEGMPLEAVATELKGTLAVVALVSQGASEQEISEEIQQIVNKKGTVQLKSVEGIKQAKATLQTGLDQMSSPWFRFFVKYDPAVDLRKVRCPVLAVIGEKDLQVLPDLNLPAIESALKESGITDYRCKVLPGLNHLFQTAKTGTPSEYQSIEETMSPVLLETVTDWILKH